MNKYSHIIHKRADDLLLLRGVDYQGTGLLLLRIILSLFLPRKCLEILTEKSISLSQSSQSGVSEMMKRLVLDTS